MNTSNFIARIGNETIELNRTNNGTPVTTLRVAIQRRKGRDGEDRGAVWADLKVWGKLAEVVAAHLGRGHQIGVTAHVDSEEWVDKASGDKRSKIVFVAENIDFLARPRNADASAAPAQDAAPAPDSAAASDDDIPF